MSKPSQLGLTSAYERAYQAVCEAYQNSGLPSDKAKAAADNTILSQSYLRLEILLSTTQTAYQLNVLNNQNNAGANQRPTEVRLSQQDSFFASQMGMYIAKASSATDYTFILHSYPNATVFATGNAALGALYNGQGSITINNQKIVPKFPLSDFYNVPQTQNGVGITAQTVFAIDQIDMSEVALMQPNINFVGTNQSTIDVVVPQSFSALDANTYLVFILKGVLAQNVTVLV